MNHGVSIALETYPILNLNFDFVIIVIIIQVPTQKMPRLLSTSASACRRLILKAKLMDVDTAALEFQETQVIQTTFSLWIAFLNIYLYLCFFKDCQFG